MKHHKKHRTLGRKRDVRAALLRSLALALVERGKITTTEAKAKELRPFVEKLVTRATEGTLAATRHAVAQLGTEGAKKLMDEVAPKYVERPGGYTRVLKLPRREGDAARMAVVEFV